MMNKNLQMEDRRRAHNLIVQQVRQRIYQYHRDETELRIEAERLLNHLSLFLL